jgi:hypothetical protein
MDQPILVPEALEAEYRRDLETWTRMVESFNNTMTWRDEQSFKRGWVVGRGIKP